MHFAELSRKERRHVVEGGAIVWSWVDGFVALLPAETRASLRALGMSSADTFQVRLPSPVLPQSREAKPSNDISLP